MMNNHDAQDDNLKPTSGNHYNQSVFGNNSQTPAMDASKFTKDVRELRQPMHLDSGAVYEGEWLNGVRDGQGKQEWLDGSRYEG